MKNKEGLLGIAEQIQELDNLEKEIYQSKQEKGQLLHDINLLTKDKEEISVELHKKKDEFKAEISSLEKITSGLQTKRDGLIANTAPEIAQLTSLKEQINRDNVALETKQTNLNRQYNNLSKEQAELEEKKRLLEQIIEIAKQL